MDKSDDLETVENVHRPIKKSVKIVLERGISREVLYSREKMQSPKATTSMWIETKEEDKKKSERNATECDLTNTAKDTFKRKMKKKDVATALFAFASTDHADTDHENSAIQIKEIKSEHEVLVSVVESLQTHQEQNDSDDAVFSRYVSSEISHITDFRAKQIAKFKILNLIFDAQFVKCYSSMGTPPSVSDTISVSKQLPILYTAETSIDKDNMSDNVPSLLFPKSDEHKKGISNTAIITPSSKKGVNYRLSKQSKEGYSDVKCDKIKEDSAHGDTVPEKRPSNASAVVFKMKESNPDSVQKSKEIGSDNDLSAKKELKECIYSDVTESTSSVDAGSIQQSKAETNDIASVEKVQDEEKATTTDEMNGKDDEITKDKDDVPEHS